MKLRRLLIVTALSLCGVMFTAQTQAQAQVSTSPQSQNSAQPTSPTDEIIAYGTRRQDPAMSAYLAGDYEVAEIEFKANAFCALRASRNFKAGLDSAQENSIRGDLGITEDIASQPTGGVGGSGGAPTSAPSITPTAPINASNFNKTQSTDARTCEDRGFQLYMAGLSQLKLGKSQDAKESFSRAVVLRKSIYDAYFRLALLEYQDGDIKSAKKQYKQLRRLQKNCRKKCEFNAEINGQIDYLKNLLGT